MNGLYQNNKNKKLYYILNIATDCTNSRCGNKVIIYKNIDEDEVFVRDMKEFEEKFTSIGVN